MQLKHRIFVSLLIVLFLTSVFTTYAPEANAVATAPSYINIDLSGTLNVVDFPYGIDCSDSTYVYQTIHNQGLLVRIDRSTQAVTLISDPENVVSGQDFYAIVRDTSGNLFINERDNGELWKYVPSSGTWTRIPIVQEITGNSDITYPDGYNVKPKLVRVDENPASHGLHTYEFGIPSFGGVVFANGKVWVAIDYDLDFDSQAEANAGAVDISFHGVVEVDPSSLATSWYSITGASNLRGMEVDGNIIWITDQGQSKIFKFDTVGKTVTQTITLTAGSNPRELSLDATFLYVALNKPAGGNLGIAKVTKSSGASTTIDLGVANTAGGTFATYLSGNILGWSSDSQKAGYVALTTNVVTSFTTTSTNNHFMCTVGTQFWIAGKGSASVVIIDIPAPESGVPFSSITIPTIQCEKNVYRIQSDSVTLNCFEFMLQGASAGDFMETMTPAQYGQFSGLSPSSGTFRGLGYSVKDNSEIPTECQRIWYLPWCRSYYAAPAMSPILTISDTQYGFLCGAFTVAQHAKDCASSTPIAYRTFSISISGIPVTGERPFIVKIQATGTAEAQWQIDAGFGTVNILVYRGD